jgi:hypothetical protein
MVTARKVAVWIVIASLVAIGIRLTVTIVRRERRVTLRGAVLRQDTDPSKQVPIAGADITAITGNTACQAKSNESGFFSITLPKGFRRLQVVTLQFAHPRYQPLELNDLISDKLYIALMKSVAATAPADSQPPQVISHVRLRYVVRSTENANVGSAMKTFQVKNAGNVSCNPQKLCSPDGKWEAATASISLDAGTGNAFRNVRASCIGGPCPFTRIDHEMVSDDGRHLDVTARAWSDTATFLVEAEVIRLMSTPKVRESYPVIFGPSLSFTLPASAEGPSIEAELNGEAIVFPLPPNLSLRWAQCVEGRSKDDNRVYRCELTPGYRFQ